MCSVPFSRFPQAHAAPFTLAFSVFARSHVHSPAGRARHEQRAPSTLFSVFALLQLHAMAGCLPQEQVAFFWQLQLPGVRPQQVEGTAIVGV